MPPASTRGGRGGASASSLKFKPKTSARRSAADRAADEKAEAAKVKKEQDAVDRERKRAEKRAERGRGGGRERGRGGATMLGGGMSHLTGSISGVPGRGGGWGSGGGGGGGWGSGGGGGARVKTDGAGTGGAPIERMEIDGRRLINIDDIATINLLSDSDNDDEDIATSTTNKGKGSARDRDDRKPKRTPGLPPVRIARQEHIPRRMKVNIDLTDLPDDASKEAAKAVISSSTTDARTSTVPIKIEDDTDTAAGAAPVKIKRESDLQSPTRARKTRNAVLKGTPAVPTTIDLDDKPVPPSQIPGGSRGEEIGGQIGHVMVQRPLWIPEDCNFMPQPRPAGWESKEDVANWDRNVSKAYSVYNLLATKEGKRKGMSNDLETKKAEQAESKAKAKEDADGDVEMKDADASASGSTVADAAADADAEETKPDVKPEAAPKEKDPKEGVVFLFQIPPGIPGLEGLKTAADIAREKEELEILSSAPTPTTKSNKPSTSTSASRVKASTTSATKSKPSSSTEPKIKTEPTIKPDPDSDPKDPVHPFSPTSTSSTPLKPGYIGDLVIYNTGAAQLSWGGLPLRVKAGTQSNQLQHVLLTNMPVTKELAEEAERERERVKKEEGGAGDKEAAKEKEKEKAYCLGTIGGYLTCVPDFKEFFGEKWKYHC